LGDDESTASTTRAAKELFGVPWFLSESKLRALITSSKWKPTFEDDMAAVGFTYLAVAFDKHTHAPWPHATTNTYYQIREERQEWLEKNCPNS